MQVPGMVSSAVHGLNGSLPWFWGGMKCTLFYFSRGLPQVYSVFVCLLGWGIFIVLFKKCNQIVTIKQKLLSRRS